jgi:hypothetical protein
MDILNQLTQTYKKALKEIKTMPEYKNIPLIHKKSFACSVATLCHDDPNLPVNLRMSYLTSFTKLTGGPTVREHYCSWCAYGRGDSIRHDNTDELVSFEIDPRFQTPGTWPYDMAFNFALKTVFAPLSDLHKHIYKVEFCCDDTTKDLIFLKS